MNKSKFTKDVKIGISTDESPLCIDGIDEAGEIFEVCYVWGVIDSEVSCDQSRANAHLIAAAPEMYAMLEDLKNHHEYDLRKEINELLARARGEL